MNRLIVGLWLLLFAAGLLPASAQIPSTRPALPKPRPLLLLAPFTGEKLVVRAASATVQGAVLQVELPDGSRNAWDSTALVATLPWYTETELTGGMVDLAALGRLYDNAAHEHPDFASGLFAEKAKAREAADTREKERAAKVAAVLSARYDSTSGYTIEELHARIRAADEAAALDPARQAEIARAIIPFREHLAHLEAGEVFSDGQWRTPEELRRQQSQAADAERMRVLAEHLQVSLETQVLDARRVNQVLGVAGVLLGAPVLLGGVLLFRRRRRLFGTVLIVLPVAAGALAVRALSSTGFPEPEFPETADSEGEFVRALAAAGTAGTEPANRHLRVSAASVNAFLSRRVKLQGAPAEGAVNLRRVTVDFHVGGATVYELAEWRGHPLSIQQDYEITSSGGKTVVTDGSTRIGRLPVPDPVQGWLRVGLTQAFGGFLQTHGLPTVYAPASINGEGVELVATAPVPTPTPPRVVTATPVPAATPPSVVTTPTPEPSMPVAAATPTPTAPAEEEDTPLPPLPAAGTTPGPDNTFYVYAIWDGINSASAGEIAKQMDRLREQFGKGNRYHRIGFAFILGSEGQLRTICNLAREKGLAIGLILGTQTHSGAAKSEVKEDFRAVQWRLDGAEWRGGKDPRDAMVPTPSRYCRAVRDALEKEQKSRCEIVRRVMDSFPGVITCIDSTIEEELADGGQNDDARLADYSPYAVTEFRDWLRHTGLYDADTGHYAGQGAPEHLTGPFVSVKGKMRSPFYNARSPDDAPVGGSSFNQRFGTNFKTWRLKYWDLEAFQERIIDEKFDPTPSSGKGYTEGGFDAPRQRNNTLWWQVWSWDYQDNGNRYPPGATADAPAFGFRQVMVHNFVVDMLRVGLRARLPANLLFAHQIPGEEAGAARDRSSASPAWTGYLPFNGTVGVTRFGFFDPKLALQYTKANPQSRGWGIFEWHPKPFTDPQDPKLYETATEHLRTYYRDRCHHLFAGWWKTDPPKGKQDFPLADSLLAKAIKDFMASCPDQPYPGTPR